MNTKTIFLVVSALMSAILQILELIKTEEDSPNQS